MRNCRSSILIINVLSCIALTITIMMSAAPHATAAQSGNATGTFLNVGDGKIYYEECGTGDEAVLLVHDGVVHSAVWDDIWPAFCRHFHTIRYDRRGYGRSPAATSW